MSENVDAISSMIYPSHWSNGDFGLDAPDTEPYKTVNRYIQKENSLLDSLGKKNQFLVHGFKISQHHIWVMVIILIMMPKQYLNKFRL